MSWIASWSSSFTYFLHRLRHILTTLSFGNVCLFIFPFSCVMTSARMCISLKVFFFQLKCVTTVHMISMWTQTFTMIWSSFEILQFWCNQHHSLDVFFLSERDYEGYIWITFDSFLFCPSNVARLVLSKPMQKHSCIVLLQNQCFMTCAMTIGMRL